MTALTWLAGLAFLALAAVTVCVCAEVTRLHAARARLAFYQRRSVRRTTGERRVGPL